MANYGRLECLDSTYADARAGTGTLDYNPGLRVGSRFLDGDYEDYLAFIEFETDRLASAGDVAYLSFYANHNEFPSTSSFIVYVAVYDYGTLDTGDWLSTATLAGLTPIGSFDADDLTEAFTGIHFEINTAALNLSGMTRLVLYTSLQLAETAPVDESTYLNLSDVYLLTKTNYSDPGSVSTFEDEVDADTPALWYRMEASSGTAELDAVGSEDGTYFNTVELQVATGLPTTPGVRFESVDPGSSYLKSDNSIYAAQAFSSGLALEIIFNWEQIDTGSEYWLSGFGYEEAASTELAFEFHTRTPGDPSNGIFVKFYNGIDYVAALPILALNEVYHIIASYDPTDNYVLYVNGDAWRSIPMDEDVVLALDEAPELFGADNYFYVGGDAFDPDSIEGWVDEQVLYETGLSFERARKHYKAAFNPPPIINTIELVIEGLDPVVSAGAAVLPDLLSLLVDILPPDISADGSIVVLAETIALAINALDPAIETGVHVTVTPATLELTVQIRNISLLVQVVRTPTVVSTGGQSSNTRIHVADMVVSIRGVLG